VHVLPSLTSVAGIFSKYANLAYNASRKPGASQCRSSVV